MSDCEALRRALLADPRDPDPRWSEHRASCQECNQFAERLLRLESRLDRALRVTLPPPAAAAAPGAAGQSTDAAAPHSARVVPLRPKARRTVTRLPAYRKSWLAMAASVVLACVVAGALWLSVPGPSLAADVVTHMREEPQAWRRTDVPVPSAALQEVLRDSHLRLAVGTDVVSYASSCSFRGHQVPHLVMQTESGPVTVMVLVHDHVPKTVRFDEQGYRGVIVPVTGHGSLAVLTRGADTDIKTVERIAARVQASIVWTG